MGFGASRPIIVTPEMVTVRSLRRAGLVSPLATQAEKWISSLTPELDHEYGPHFWQWIVEQFEITGNPFYDTLFLEYKPSHELIATASIVFDDRGVGKEFNISGAWLGGLSVRREFRRQSKKFQGVGRVMMGAICHHAQAYADHDQILIRLNCFTTGTAAKLNAEYGFIKFGHYYVKHFGFAADFYQRTFEPQRSPEV